MKNDGLVKIFIFVIVGFILLKTCSNTKKRSGQTMPQTSQLDNWQKSPVDQLIIDYADDMNFSIILFDMDVEDPKSSKPTYKHQYRVIRELPDTVLAEETKWYPVTPVFFQKHIDNLGMELATKTNGALTKQVSPAGYSNYIGNSRYGEWRERNGNSFWSFYGRYAFMSSMFNLMTMPARRDYWNDYNRNYYGTNRPYYGPSGQKVYGTDKYTASTKGQSTKWGNKSSDFKSSVRSSVKRSSTATTSRKYSSSSSYNKTSRSSTRSSGSTSYRSRSGGYGK